MGCGVNRWHAHWAPRPPEGAEPPRESLAMLLIGGAALVLLFVLLFVLLPVMT